MIKKFREAVVCACCAILASNGGGADLQAASPLQSATQVSIADKEIRLVGEISSAAAGRVESLLKSDQGEEIGTLRVSATSGDTQGGLRLAKLVREHQLELKVERACGTVCAFYVVPAAPRVTFEPGAVLLFGQMPSPQLRAISIESKLLDKSLSEAERARLTSQDEQFTKVLGQQDAFYRSLGVDPSRMFMTMDVWMDLVRGLRASGKAADAVNVLFSPDEQFVHECLGLTNVDWRDFTIADSASMAHMGRSPLALLSEGQIYYEGEKVPSKPYTCTPPTKMDARDG